MIEPADSELHTPLGNHDSGAETSGPYRHPLGVGIGAVLAAGTAGATGGALVGPVGAIFGAVVGAVAGGYGGHAIAEMVDPPRPENPIEDQDDYVTRVHSHTPQGQSEASESNTSNPDIRQAVRESWHRLDESSKELLEVNSDETDDV